MVAKAICAASAVASLGLYHRLTARTVFSVAAGVAGTSLYKFFLII